MSRIWWAQIKAVVRLEFKKTLFARRGLWIYALAALPVLLYIAFAVATANRNHQSQQVARRGEKALTLQNLTAQPMGTADGTTPDANGTRVFFVNGPTTTGGTGTVTVTGEGTATLTAANQQYYAYTGVLAPNATSSGMAGLR